MTENETIKQLEALKEHCLSIQEIYDCTDYESYITALDTAVRLIEKMKES